MACTRPDRRSCSCSTADKTVFRAQCRRCAHAFHATHSCFTEYIDAQLDKDKLRNKKHQVSRQQAYSFYMAGSGKNYALRCPSCPGTLAVLEHPDNRTRAEPRRRTRRTPPKPAPSRGRSDKPGRGARPVSWAPPAATAPPAPEEALSPPPPPSPPPSLADERTWPAIGTDGDLARLERAIDADLCRKRCELARLDRAIDEARRSLYEQQQIFAWAPTSRHDWPPHFDSVVAAA